MYIISLNDVTRKSDLYTHLFSTNRRNYNYKSFFHYFLTSITITDTLCTSKLQSPQWTLQTRGRWKSHTAAKEREQGWKRYLEKSVSEWHRETMSKLFASMVVCPLWVVQVVLNDSRSHGSSSSREELERAEWTGSLGELKVSRSLVFICSRSHKELGIVREWAMASSQRDGPRAELLLDGHLG